MNVAGQFGRFASAIDVDPNGRMSLLQLRHFLTREWRVIALVTVLSVGLGALHITLAPLKYTAQTDMFIDTKRDTTHPNVISDNRTIEDAAVESEINTTRSENVAMGVINRLHLDQDPEFVATGHGLTSRILALFGLAANPKDDNTRRALTVLKRNLDVNRMGRSYIEQISYTSLDADKAAKIANAFADSYIEDQLRAKFDATHRASVWLEQRIGELRQQATEAFRAVQEFKSKNGIIVGPDGKLSSDVELDQLGIALAKARANTSEARAKLDRITHIIEQRTDNKEDFNIPDPVVTDALNNLVITKLRQQFLEEKNKEAELSARYGREHQSARNMRADMSNLQKAMWDEIYRIAESYKSEFQITKSQEEALDKRVGDVFEKSTSTRQAQVQLRELETAASTYRNIYETYLSRFTQSVQQQTFPSTDARIVTPASRPSFASSPKKVLTLALATFCGLALGVMVAFGREQLNFRVHTRTQLENAAGTTCLAVLPEFKDRRLASLRRGPAGALQLIGELAPFSASAEALRHIKVAIDLHPTGGKVIGIVSALPGEGKTTVAGGFASFLAKSAARTLVIDADFRKPSLTRNLGYSSSQGLPDLVAGKASFEDVVITDNRYKFDFVPASAQIRVSNSSDILNSSSAKEMLKQARNNYDYVIIDLPPILSVVDVKAAAHLFDAFVLVVEWASTAADEVQSAVTSSPVLSERLLGAVLNKADEAVIRRFEGYSDRRYRYYTDEKLPAETL